MNWDQIEGNWKQVKGRVKEKWGQFTDDDLDVLAGKRDQLVGKLQERYGIAKAEAERQVVEFRTAYEAEYEKSKGARSPSCRDTASWNSWRSGFTSRTTLVNSS